MDLIKIGKYIAGKVIVTKKQLAEKLGMSNKSVSIAGVCLPDICL